MKYTLLLISFAFLAFAANKQREEIDKKVAEKNKVVVKDTVAKVNNKATVIHAGADEMYPDVGYDKDGWSLRGYMSSSELRGDHLKTAEAKAKLHQRKKQVIKDFIDSMSYKAKRICRKYDFPPSILVAQAYLESAYGTSRLAVKANNFFGHMMHKDFTDRGLKGKIKAYDRNIKGKLKSYYFRVYESQWWSMYYHVNMIKNNYAYRMPKNLNKRDAYLAALCGCKDSRMLADDSAKTAKSKNGYLYAGSCAWKAKDGVTSRYIAELKYIIRLYNLEKLDE